MKKDFFSELFATCERLQENIAIIEHRGIKPARHVSFGKLYSMASSISMSINKIGKMKTVGIYMRRSPEHVASILASLIIQRPFFSINPMMSATQIQDMASQAEADVLIIDNSALLKLTALPTGALNNLRLLHIPDTEISTAHKKALEKLASNCHVSTLDTNQNNMPGISASRVNNPLLPACILFTSGSTGRPRGVLIGDGDLLQRTIAESDAYDISPEDVLLSILPFSFDVGANQLYTSLFKGATLVILNSWLPKDIDKAIKSYKVTGISGVPTIWSSILDQGDEFTREILDDLRYITISGGDLPEKKRLQLRELGPNLSIFKTYGQSETFRSGMLMPDEFDKKAGSVGRPPPNVEVHIFDEKQKLLPNGEIGEIYHCGVGTMLGYIGDSAETETKRIPNPGAKDNSNSILVRTGDYGKIDHDGYLYILGRKDRMIKIRGNRVYPEEIEQQLMQHPNVTHAVVTARAVEPEIELIAGVASGSNNIDIKELKSFLARRVPLYMLPGAILAFSEFPMTSSGKVDISRTKAILISQQSS